MLRKMLFSSALLAAALAGGLLSPAVGAQVPVYLAEWGTAGSGDGQFNGPHGVAVDSDGYVYVTDTFNDRVQKFNSEGDYILQWGSSGTGDGQFSWPMDVAVDASGNVFVTDKINCRIQVFNTSGIYLRQWGTNGSGDGQFYSPLGIAVDRDGYVYVADTGNARIQKFTSAGLSVTQWGVLGSGTGQFQSPSDVAVGDDGTIYVADTMNFRVQAFTPAGLYITAWGSSGTGDGEFDRPEGVVCDALGNIFVADTYNNRMQKFTSTGTYLTQWGSPGGGPGQFNLPVGLAFNVMDDTFLIYVVDHDNNRVQKFGACSSSLALAYPRGGETLIAGTDTTITWTPAECSGSAVRLELLRLGTVCETIADSTENDGHYRWRVGRCGSATTDYRVRVTSLEVGSTGQSDADFRIVPSYRILAIGDVGNDQGRQVRVRWHHEDHDVVGGSPVIASYSIWRRIDAYMLSQNLMKGRTLRRGASYPPGTWDFVKTVPAHAEGDYSTVCETLCDSTISDGQCWSVFFVRAETSTPATYFDTYPDSGYSKDNLAPATLAGLHYSQSHVLSWTEAPEADFNYYSVYVSDKKELDGSAILLRDRLSSPTCDVEGVWYHYVYVTATDFAGNRSEGAREDSPPVDANASGELPPRLALRPVTPNPAVGNARVAFDLPRDTQVRIRVFDVAGRTVATLVDGARRGGSHVVSWNGRRSNGEMAGSGIYFVKMEAGGQAQIQKMVVAR